jgi:glutamate-1-semialdehyde 2,1-aminomutase
MEYRRRFEKTLGGVTGLGGTPLDGRPPVILTHGEGSHVWDINGKEYIDYTCGGGSLQLGYGHPRVVEAIAAALESPPPLDEMKNRLAEKVIGTFPSVETVKFVGSESESVHAAIRLTRSITQKNSILKFEGHYHGWFDNVAWDSNHSHAPRGARENPNRFPLSMGQTFENTGEVLLLPWNDLDLLEKTLEERSDDIACLLSEPVIAYAGIPPVEGYLPGVADLCRHFGVYFILDERLTGFRWEVGGAQAYHGFQADLTLFSHVLDGGLALGAVAGPRKTLDFWDRIFPLGSVEEPNRLSLVAGNATLETLLENDAILLHHSWKMTGDLVDGIAKIGSGSSLPLSVRPFPCCFQTYFPQIPQQEILAARSYSYTDWGLLFEWILELEDRGILISPSGGWGVTSVHRVEDTERTLECAEDSLRSLQRKREN